MKRKIIIITMLTLVPAILPAYGKSMERTPKGEIEVKIIPETTVLETKGNANYFDEDNKMFRNLFRYISDHDIAMTTPVTVDVDPGAMRFVVSEKDLEKAKESTEKVSVITLPERIVVSVGYNGRYSQKNYDKHLEQLTTWLEENAAEWVADGEAIAVYWDGPFKLAAWKQAEVMIPVRKAIPPCTVSPALRIYGNDKAKVAIPNPPAKKWMVLVQHLS